FLGEPDVASGVLGGQATADEAGRGGADGFVVVLVVGRDVAVAGRGDGEDLHRQLAQAGLLPGDGFAFVLGAGLPDGRLDDLRAGEGHPEVAPDGPVGGQVAGRVGAAAGDLLVEADEDRKSTRLNSSHVKISYAVFCLKKKKT